MSDVNPTHRHFLGTATAGLSAAEFAVMGAAYAAAKLWKPPARLAPSDDGIACAAELSGPRTHRAVPNASRNLPRETPQAFADAVLALVKRG